MRRGLRRPVFLFGLVMLLIRVPACEYQEDQGSQTNASPISVTPSPALLAAQDAGPALA